MPFRFAAILALLVTSTSVWAQDCQSNLYMTANARLVMTIYDKKGKENGRQIMEVTEVKSSGAEYESGISTTVIDAKGKTLSFGRGLYRCKAGVLSADLQMAIPHEVLMKNAEARFDPVYLDYPTSLVIGQKLPDAELRMELTLTNGTKATLTFREEGRTVTAQETVSSPAGTWEAYVIGYKGTIKTRVSGVGMPGFTYSIKEWFAPGTGIVKSETYNKNGALVSSNLLTGVTKEKIEQ